MCQGCGISVGDCGFLWQALGVKTYRDHSQVPVVPKEARDILNSNGGNGSDQREQEPSPPDSPVNERPVVLIVDDDAGVREALRFALDEHFTVLDAPHGRSALGIVRAERVDLVLLDILMPEVDGLEILQELKAVEPDIPVIMMTAVKTVRTTVAAMKLGAADYVTKPFQEDELLASIRQALEQRARRLGASVERDRPDRDAWIPGPTGYSSWAAIRAGARRSPSCCHGPPASRRARPWSTVSTTCSASVPPASS